MVVEIYKEKFTNQVREVILGATGAEGGTRSHSLTVRKRRCRFFILKGPFPIALLWLWMSGILSRRMASNLDVLFPGCVKRPRHGQKNVWRTMVRILSPCALKVRILILRMLQPESALLR